MSTAAHLLFSGAVKASLYKQQYKFVELTTDVVRYFFNARNYNSTSPKKGKLHGRSLRCLVFAHLIEVQRFRRLPTRQESLCACFPR